LLLAVLALGGCVGSRAVAQTPALSLLEIPSGSAPTDSNEPDVVPAAASFFRFDIYTDDAPPTGTYPEEFASARQGSRIVPILIPDPLDRAALGSRNALVLVHGLSLRDSEDPDQIHPYKAATWDTFRQKMPASLRTNYKAYMFLYPTRQGPRPPGQELSRQIQQLLRTDGSPGARVGLVGHSMGGLTIRHAMNANQLGEKVTTAITLATPHHGSPVASVISANDRIRDKIGWLRWIALKGLLALSPRPHAIEELAYDNANHELDPTQAKDMGFKINDQLLRFNQEDHYLDRVTACMVDLRQTTRPFSMWRPLRYIPPYILSPIAPSFGSLDPVVHFESGNCDGMRVGRRMDVTGVDHMNIYEDSAVLDRVYDRLAEAARPAATVSMR
jgi:pimeloyl-ACP methyl ester carboxylesterase